MYLKNIAVLITHARIVVQPGRTLRSGRRGRWFESSQSDQNVYSWQLLESPSAHVPLFVHFAEGLSAYLRTLSTFWFFICTILRILDPLNIFAEGLSAYWRTLSTLWLLQCFSKSCFIKFFTKKIFSRGVFLGLSVYRCFLVF